MSSSGVIRRDLRFARRFYSRRLSYNGSRLLSYWRLWSGWFRRRKIRLLRGRMRRGRLRVGGGWRWS